MLISVFEFNLSIMSNWRVKTIIPECKNEFPLTSKLSPHLAGVAGHIIFSPSLSLFHSHSCYAGRQFWLETLSAEHTFDLDCFPKWGLIIGLLDNRRQPKLVQREVSPLPRGFILAQGSQWGEEIGEEGAGIKRLTTYWAVGNIAIAGVWNSRTYRLGLMVL